MIPAKLLLFPSLREAIDTVWQTIEDHTEYLRERDRLLAGISDDEVLAQVVKEMNNRFQFLYFVPGQIWCHKGKMGFGEKSRWEFRDARFLATTDITMLRKEQRELKCFQQVVIKTIERMTLQDPNEKTIKELQQIQQQFGQLLKQLEWQGRTPQLGVMPALLRAAAWKSGGIHSATQATLFNVQKKKAGHLVRGTLLAMIRVWLRDYYSLQDSVCGFYLFEQIAQAQYYCNGFNPCFNGKHFSGIGTQKCECVLSLSRNEIQSMWISPFSAEEQRFHSLDPMILSKSIRKALHTLLLRFEEAPTWSLDRIRLLAHERDWDLEKSLLISCNGKNNCQEISFRDIKQKHPAIASALPKTLDVSKVYYFVMAKVEGDEHLVKLFSKEQQSQREKK